jgi:adenosine deaminase CECR1
MAGRGTHIAYLRSPVETILVRINRRLYDALMKHLKLLILGMTGWAFLFSAALLAAESRASQDWFETFKDQATPAELHTFLYAMPKGGDLHIHLTGAVFSEWAYDLALAQGENGYQYYAKQRIDNCASGLDGPRRTPYLLLHHTIDHLSYAELGPCEQGEYVPLDDLTETQKTRWLNSLRLDKPHEGRDEFFEKHWSRLSDLGRNPYLVAEFLVANMRAFGAEGVVYIEPQMPIFGFITPAGEALTPDQVLGIYNARLVADDAQATNVEVRMQVALLRFLPNAEEVLSYLYKFAHAHDQVVAVNMVGREDNDKGYPLRFLDTLRELRRTHSGVRLSIHAGEVDEPNFHIRDTLLLGAERIGHGVNLITDPDTLVSMRYGPYLVEINLISNLLLEYVSDYSQHPFPEYLRLGVPVALSTDDRGMWDSTMTDEFFVAVSEFDLTWAEVRTLSRNSIEYSFVDEETKARLLRNFDKSIEKFSRNFQRNGANGYANAKPPRRGFICRQYSLCP